MTAQDGGAAFPRPALGTDCNKPWGQQTVMSLRDYFAGQALAGILAGGFADTVPHDDISGGGQAAYFAYQYADAMLAARNIGGGA